MKKLIALCFVFGIATLQSQAPSQNDKDVTIKMKVSQWNIVIKALRELPYKESEAPIDEILSQANQQLRPPSKTDSTRKKQ